MRKFNWTKIDKGAEVSEDENTPLMGSPFGLFPNDEFHPLRMFNLFLVDTDVSIAYVELEAVSCIDGVECVTGISRYKFIIGFGNMFKEEECKDYVELLLGGAYNFTEITKIKSREVRAKVIDSYKELKLFKHWSLVVFPNGEIRSAYSDDQTDFKTLNKEIKEIHHVTKGIFLSSEGT